MNHQLLARPGVPQTETRRTAGCLKQLMVCPVTVVRFRPACPSPKAAAGFLGFLLGTLVLVAAAADPKPAPQSSPRQKPPTTTHNAESLAYFESKVRPLLVRQCGSCHGQKVSQGGLRLHDPSGIRRGGEKGPVVVPGKPHESRLLEAVSYANPRLRMPPTGKLSAAEIEVLTTWVARGAPMPAAGASTAARRPMSIEEGRRFWSIRPLLVSKPPKVRNTRWPTRRIDSYLLGTLEAKRLSPSPPADRATLIRRVTFDLIGLPPTPEEVQSFVADSSPAAYDRLVDRLLASPHYGERWARHWLDLVRYCDVPESWAKTDARPWLYRDWVVTALNQGLSYRDFVTRQLAADEMENLPTSELAALGFIGLSPNYWKELKLTPDLIKIVVAEEWEERIHTVSSTILGMTVACARCHDHKFDPITSSDYYALAGVFASTKAVARPLLPKEDAQRVQAARVRMEKLEDEAKLFEDMAVRQPTRAADLKKDAASKRAEAKAIEQSTPDINCPKVYAVETGAVEVLPDGPDRTKVEYREGTGQDICLQARGDPTKMGPQVPRRFLTVLSPGEPMRLTRGSGRLDLAEAMFRDGAPLTARVIVNRVWRHHFGRGLVETPSNFGTQGDRPTHPELLDDLSSRFIESGWSLKWLHREIVLSSAYRQASGPAPNPQLATRNSHPSTLDPDNRLLWRMNRRRLEVEPWRDAILSASGTLDRRIGGEPMELKDPKHLRRTLYGSVARNDLDDLLRLYDFPDPMTHSAARFPTTTPLQQLFVLNSDFMGRQAAALLARVRGEQKDDPSAQIRRAYLLLYGRLPSAVELDAVNRFLAAGGQSDDAWKQCFETLLARNELMFVD